MFGGVRDMAAGYGRDPDAMQLFVRANAHVTDRPLGRDRPAFCGSTVQIIDDLDATRQTGAHEIILDLQSCASTIDELLDLAQTVTHPILSTI